MTDENRIKRQDWVARWKASGDTAQVFSAREGIEAGTLKWWAVELRRELKKSTGAVPSPMVQLVRSGASAPRTAGVVIDLLDAHARITVEPGADRATLATVLELLRARSAA
jgi:hypothetical protein